MKEGLVAQMSAKNKKIDIIPGATHQFGEPGALEEVARLPANGFNPPSPPIGVPMWREYLGGLDGLILLRSFGITLFIQASF
jgi:hypothetical protein